MAFVKFTRTRSRIGIPKAAIWMRGQIGFNRSAVEEYNFGNYSHVLLYYDRDTARIGFEFTNDEKSPGVTKLIKRQGGSISISVRAFLKYNKIDSSENRQYELGYDIDSKLYFIDLNKKL
jgi:hypothetical protein